jgi:hypothetical protein
LANELQLFIDHILPVSLINILQVLVQCVAIIAPLYTSYGVTENVRLTRLVAIVHAYSRAKAKKGSQVIPGLNRIRFLAFATALIND